MKLGSLFSGIGGIELGLYPFGIETVWFVESDKYASAVLSYRYPDIPNYGDIARIDWREVEPVGILCGDFPCQDISFAGKGAGIADGTRSGLWSYFADAISILRPRYVFVENVSAIVFRSLDRAFCDLAQIGFDAQWCCLRASSIGAPHRRERFFLVAIDTDYKRDDRTGAQSTGWRNLRTEVNLLRTPTASEWKGPNHSRSDTGSAHGLSTQVEHLLPTPWVLACLGRLRRGAANLGPHQWRSTHVFARRGWFVPPSTNADHDRGRWRFRSLLPGTALQFPYGHGASFAAGMKARFRMAAGIGVQAQSACSAAVLLSDRRRPPVRTARARPAGRAQQAEPDRTGRRGA
jgi:site-specific DNA-cytosine methylase